MYDIKSDTCIMLNINDDVIINYDTNIFVDFHLTLQV